MTDYGVSLDAILSGKEKIPAQGVRIAEPIADLSENVSLGTAAQEYAWVNTRQIWGYGTVNFATGKIHIDAYMQ